MNAQRRLALVAAAATILASTALASVYQSSVFPLFILDAPNWFLYVAAAVAAVAGGATGARALRAPIWVHPLAGLGALLLYVTVVFGQGALLGVIPMPHTFGSLASQVQFAFAEISELSAPVPVHRGLLLLAVLGVGLMAVVVDMFAVTLRRASLAGLPLLVLYAVPVSIDRDALSWWMFALGAGGYLWLLVTEQLDRVSRWGRPFRSGQRDPWVTSSLGSTGRWVGAFGIVVAALIPVLVPGISTAGWFDGIGGQFGSGGGRSVETINPITQLRGQLTQKRTVELLRVRTNDKDPFYLRLTTLDQYGKRGWTQHTLSATPEQRLSRGISDVNGISDALPTVTQHTDIQVAGLGGSYLPLYANPRKVKAKGDWRWEDQSDTAFSTVAQPTGLTYSFDSERVAYDARTLLAATDLAAGSSQVKNFTALSGSVDPDVKTIIEPLIAGKRTQYERVVAINDYFSPSNGFIYDTTTAQGTTGNDLLEFLNHKRGYCEQYASAMAYMVRAAGIPARVAVGFGRGTDHGSYISVTNHDAHAWVEVYFSGSGWVPFDPTPPGGAAGTGGGLTWTKLPAAGSPGAIPSSGPIDPNNGQNQQQAPNTPDRQRKSDTETAVPQAAGQDRFPAWASPVFGLATPIITTRNVPSLPAWLWWAIGLLVAAVVASVPALWRLETRRIRLAHVRSPNPLVSAHSAWDEVVDTLVDVGLPVSTGQTPRTIAGGLAAAGLSAEAQAAAWKLASDEEEVLYAPRTLLAARDTERSAAVAATRLVCGEIMDQALPRARVRARFLPPSLTVRTAQLISETGESVSLALAAIRESLTRLIPRRT
ncbi:MAG: hypothetical protein QOI35_1178 [Cryptosporangiaceae bacterium]|nr:hypothetical protein [Cryptosporangiaceae bacterium]